MPDYPLAEHTPALEVDRFFSDLAKLDYRQRRYRVRQQLGDAPRFLYKFRALQRAVSAEGKQGTFTHRAVTNLRDVIVHSKLRLSCPTTFNDPFDTTAFIIAEGTVEERREKFRNMVKEHGAGMNWKEREAVLQRMMSEPPEAVLSRARTSFQGYIAQFGVYCLVGDRPRHPLMGDGPRHVLMWSHYADNHEGVCLQFEYAKDLVNFSRAIRVEYNDEYPTINYIKKDFAPATGQAILRKHTRWEPENEYRIVIEGAANKYLSLRAEALTGIILGCRANDAVEAEVDKLLRERKAAGLPSVEKYYAQENATYGLDIWRQRRPNHIAHAALP